MHKTIMGIGYAVSVHRHVAFVYVITLTTILCFFGCRQSQFELLGRELWYKSSDVSPQVYVAVQREAEKVGSERKWWSEGIIFSPLISVSRLEGWSKIPSIFYDSESGELIRVDERDWRFMLYWDMRFIVETLTKWSGDYNVTWTLTSEGGQIGMISHGKMDADVVEFIQGLTEYAQVSSDDEFNRIHAAELHRKYPE